MKPKQLATHDAGRKENDSGETDLFELPEATRSAPRKVINFNVCQKRDVLALAEVTAATGTPLNLTQETKELFAESAYALYDDFRAADSIDSIIARAMCGISSMTMDALSRARRTQTFAHREMDLKWATKGALVLAQLTKAYDGRRARAKQNVNVGQVKVEAGGQAVVGNVTSGSSEVPQGQEMLPPPKAEDPTPSS